ncbi:MAG TPA: glycoside hydrolase family 3 N-terminal domain-containing protein [Lacunisphaera sp.]|jgi:beta-glucosidase|nr:glycoside hydrolase family 3 N-terminal domain-containing protein [Lacunisphaera sp.]
MKYIRPHVPLLAGLFAGLAMVPARSAAESPFIHERPPAPIYHDGWIDLDKNGVKDPYEDPAEPVERRVEDLLARMTPDEKTAQMVTLYGFPRVLKDELPTPAWKAAFWKDGIGNIDEHMNGNEGFEHNLRPTHYAFPWSLHVRGLNEVQRFFVEDTRLGIPADFTNEGIRGLLHTQASSFPAQIAVACAWDRELVRTIGRITGREARALGYTNVYSPILDLARDPRWGRTVETYGEDPWLIGELGFEQVSGIQENRVVSTLKHFAVYSIPKGGRDGDARTDPQATWREVETMFLQPFRRAVRDAGALGVMASYNDYDGIPIAANRRFLTDILRGEWGFKGYVVSDSDAVEFIHGKHRVAPTALEAAVQTHEAGLDVRTNFTPPEKHGALLREALRSGRLSMDVVDARVREILRVKFWLGLFDRPYGDPAAPERVVRAPDALAASARAARESIVLLKNEGDALPLRKNLAKVLVTGPLADNPGGWWSRYGPQGLDFITPLAGIRAKLGPGVDVRYAPGCPVVDERFPESDILKEPPSAQARAGIDAAVAAARDVDAIVAVLGETEAISQESHGRLSLDLPGNQEDLLEALAATGKPLVLVLSNGRPLSVNWAAKHVPAIVEMWFPGDQGGAALADILFGDVNPSGKLSITFPKSAGQIPFNFPAKPGSQARDLGMVSGPLYPFGHGLSYTKFAYGALKISPERAGTDATIAVSCDVTNTGVRAGEEVVQLYVRDDYSSVTTYDESLRGFARVALAPGEAKTVHFTLKPADLQLFNRESQWVVEPGRFTVMIGASSSDIRLRGNFTMTAADGSAPEEALLPDERGRKP